MVVTKVLVVADRGEEGTGWAAIDDFEFLYDVFEVAILYVSSSGFQINSKHFRRKYDTVQSHPDDILNCALPVSYFLTVQCLTEPEDAKPGPPPPVCDGETIFLLHFLPFFDPFFHLF